MHCTGLPHLSRLSHLFLNLLKRDTGRPCILFAMYELGSVATAIRCTEFDCGMRVDEGEALLSEGVRVEQGCFGCAVLRV
mgnify:CR=1 FL=1